MNDIWTAPVRIVVGDGDIHEIGTIEGRDAAEAHRALADLLEWAAAELRAGSGKRLPGQGRACLGGERTKWRNQ